MTTTPQRVTDLSGTLGVEIQLCTGQRSEETYLLWKLYTRLVQTWYALAQGFWSSSRYTILSRQHHTLGRTAAISLVPLPLGKQAGSCASCHLLFF